MLSDKDGGPAFPVTFQHDQGANMGMKSQEWGGMSLRDYFAAACATGNLSDVRSPDMTPEVWADHVFTLADAMLKAREK